MIYTKQDQPQVTTQPSPVSFQPSGSAAYSGEQALSGAYPSSSFYPWNTQALPSSNPQYSWNSPMYYPPVAPYQAPGKHKFISIDDEISSVLIPLIECLTEQLLIL